MRTVKLILILGLIIFFNSCKEKTSRSNSYYNDSESNYYYEDQEAYPDDTYCSDVDYYNPDTGTRSSYTLNVEVEDNEVTVIRFSSGWLDSSEFSSEALDDDGYCSITLYDGRRFDIQITGSECSFSDGYRIESDIEDEIAAVTCPKCGFSKEEYDTYCSSCENLIENTCSRCGGFEYYVYGGLCSSCKNDDNEDW
ncbi:hypothetical protein [Gelidibacter maritimus]|uniref:Uncharacterized protein n=1 Tax=Gelidibacter maritimus TaxID=2761487 RepID=A0A7W2M8G4_9FLAO|nr:hypothetical protein [Gelidibacter maritimus]MBA6154672.1 hypothetical protein [Gelidibacter maritimus]